MAGKFVNYTGKDGKHYFKLKAGNGEVILTSQGYKAEKDRDNGVESVRKNSKVEARFQTKTATNGKHYFVLTATNGQVIGTSQMYKSESGCANGIASVTRNAGDAAVEAE
jgi:hypothetical protein